LFAFSIFALNIVADLYLKLW